MGPLLVVFGQPGLRDLAHLAERVEYIVIEHFEPRRVIRKLLALRKRRVNRNVYGSILMVQKIGFLRKTEWNQYPAMRY